MHRNKQTINEILPSKTAHSLDDPLHRYHPNLLEHDGLEFSEYLHGSVSIKRLQKVRKSHDLWWSRYKESRDQRHTEREEAKESKQERIRENLEKNHKKLKDAEERLERVRENVKENMRKLDETESEKWIGIYTQWIEDGEDKIERIEE